MTDWIKDETLVASLYEAALNPEGWGVIADLLPRTFEADGCLVQQVATAAQDFARRRQAHEVPSPDRIH
jgi:hypothetical protein